AFLQNKWRFLLENRGFSVYSRGRSALVLLFLLRKFKNSTDVGFFQPYLIGSSQLSPVFPVRNRRRTGTSAGHVDPRNQPILPIPWSTVKNIEKRYLQTKFKTIPLKKVKVIGIDEIAIGRKKGKPVYWTIVRDLVSGAVLHVDKGKEGDSLKSFLFRLHCSKAKIELVAMDMGAAYTLWVKENLPGAAIVFDHFHVIKLMNDKLDMVRRRTMAQLDADELKLLKKKRFLLLHNQEDLNEEAAAELAELKEHFKELSELHMMKEALRSIYRVVMTAQASCRGRRGVHRGDVLRGRDGAGRRWIPCAGGESSNFRHLRESRKKRKNQKKLVETNLTSQKSVI
ncbi:MAG: transposase, partial [Lentisphaeria bacterium]|nr:transposase [Lentisphaeria bacterium]